MTGRDFHAQAKTNPPVEAPEPPIRIDSAIFQKPQSQHCQIYFSAFL
jgi:hypothetical protein